MNDWDDDAFNHWEPPDYDSDEDVDDDREYDDEWFGDGLDDVPDFEEDDDDPLQEFQD
jgi:hypothetical protein